MYLSKKHPWNGGYALPKRVILEKAHRAVATFTEPRGAVDSMPYFPPGHPWSTGYAIPEEFYDETPNNAQTTPWKPRGTTDYMPNDGAWVGVEKWASLGEVAGIDTKKLILIAAGAGLLYYLLKKKR